VIETVLGPIDAERLGPTSMHEHLLSDASALGIPDAMDGPERDAVLDDDGLAALELGRLKDAWVDSRRASSPNWIDSELGDEARLPIVVDPTVWGFGGPAPGLAEVSRRSGVAIVAGVGAYIPKTRPEWLMELDENALADRFREALTDHLPGCDFRAGIVGMLAPGLPLDDAPVPLSPTGQHKGEGWERGLLRAGGRAAAETGSAAIVRLDPRRRDGLEVLDVMTEAGLAPERVVFSNVDGYARDLDALRQLAAAGATLKWCFGYEAPPRPGLATATDAERADALTALLAEGHQRQVLACGVWTKAALHEYGGWGYDHLPTTVLPMLRERGLSDTDLSRLLLTEPRRLLDR
jgi:phosphotriesterase-related protein